MVFVENIGVVKMSHAPGPWFLGVDLSLNYWPTRGGWSPVPATLENRKLQAAAPEMLAALKMVLQHGRIDDSESRMAQVAAAITKAEQ
jgi:hypothetical protein